MEQMTTEPKTKYRIRMHDDPILKQVCEPVDLSEDLSWTDQLREACIEHNGAGLAAPQIGIAKRAIYIAYGKEHGLTLINPEIIAFSRDTHTREEGCLSYPGEWTPVNRPVFITCKWNTTGGGPTLRSFEGWLARVAQHEVEHLDGICRVGDAWRARLSPVQR